ncbi:MAG: hypothetical protein IPM66_07955 [Acidobacteriota bacterium]|nr:MAG: hypothetical protein IPM66_07955 [Acidobacteriota bacterium]
MSSNEFQFVVRQAHQLSPQEQLELIKQLADSLSQLQSPGQPTSYLQFGKYRDTPGRNFATEDDFKSAETASNRSCSPH